MFYYISNKVVSSLKSELEFVLSKKCVPFSKKQIVFTSLCGII